MTSFIGRAQELSELRHLRAKSTASLIVVHGRRRIGKSALLQEFGSSFKSYYEFQGLGPRRGQTNQDQLNHFAEALASQFSLPGFYFTDWSQAFTALARLTVSLECFILIDEISWMAQHDDDFSGKLKIAWDTHFKKNQKLILGLCGSVSSWIEKNILRKTDFVGRVSWSKNIAPLPLAESSSFWGKNGQRITGFEKFTYLSAVGSIPKYLEEMIPTDTAVANISRLFFQPTGYLFQDFEKIFHDIFTSRAATYKKIVRTLVSKSLDGAAIAKILGIHQSGDLSEYLEDLCLAGFLKREFAWDLSGKQGKLSRYYIRDNYLRFYLKYVEPRKKQIEAGAFRKSGVSIDSLPGWETIRGLQFENLVIDNAFDILTAINIDPRHIVQFGRYFQTKTSTRTGCQIDLLVLDKFKTVYPCEIKFKRQIGSEVIADMEKKVNALQTRGKYSVRPVLIYCGTLGEDVKEADYFDKIFDMSSLLR